MPSQKLVRCEIRRRGSSETGSARFIPLEIYEISKRVTVTRIVILLINAAIVWYLFVQLRKGHGKH